MGCLQTPTLDLEQMPRVFPKYELCLHSCVKKMSKEKGKVNITASYVHTLDGLSLGPQLLSPAIEGLCSPGHLSRNA